MRLDAEIRKVTYTANRKIGASGCIRLIGCTDAIHTASFPFTKEYIDISQRELQPRFDLYVEYFSIGKHRRNAHIYVVRDTTDVYNIRDSSLVVNYLAKETEFHERFNSVVRFSTSPPTRLRLIPSLR